VRSEVLTVAAMKTESSWMWYHVGWYVSTILNHATSQKMAAFSTRLFVHYLCMLLVLKKVLFLKLIPILKHYCYIMNMLLIFSNLFSALYVCVCACARALACACVCVQLWWVGSFGLKMSS
jgi:hypothetical protein